MAENADLTPLGVKESRNWEINKEESEPADGVAVTSSFFFDTKSMNSFTRFIEAAMELFDLNQAFDALSIHFFTSCSGEEVRGRDTNIRDAPPERNAIAHTC